jgi:hypothetical protein
VFGRHFAPQHATCSVGFSGVIFALIVAETHVNNIQHRSFYGLFSVPAAYFPWLLLVLWQFIIPQVSFFGHLSGILAGIMYSKGWLACVTPTPSSFQVNPCTIPYRYVTSLYITLHARQLLPIYYHSVPVTIIDILNFLAIKSERKAAFVNPLSSSTCYNH